MADILLFSVGLAGCGYVMVTLGIAFLGARGLRPLSGIPLDDAPLPKLSVIVPACNEAAEIESCLRSLAAQDYPDLEIVAVNDRSTDETGAIMDRLAPELPTLRVLHIEELPAGWLGKNHANHVGAKAADGEWLLFTDGDIKFDAGALRRAVTHARRESVDHLAVFPGLVFGGFWETALVCFFAFIFSLHFKPWRIRNPLYPDTYCGVGAFNLVRRSAHDAIGGHEPLRMEVVDDVKTGKVLKARGFVSDALPGEQLVRVRWQHGFWGVIRGLEKNAFAGAEYSLFKGIGGAMLLATIGLGPVAGVWLVGWPWAIPFWVWGFVVVAAFGYSSYRLQAGPLIGLTAPIVAVALAFAVLRSLVLTQIRGGVRWRGTFYPLAELKAGLA